MTAVSTGGVQNDVKRIERGDFWEAIAILHDFQAAKTLDELDNAHIKHSEKMDEVLFHVYFLEKGDT